MASSPAGLKPCHNCRRRRLKCDRTFPRCRKCKTTGQECLGYQQFLRWGQGLASRGKMVGMTFDDVIQNRVECADIAPRFLSDASIQKRLFSSDYSVRTSPSWSLTDPLLHDLSPEARNYVLYFSIGVANRVCKDLVLYDVPEYNPFYELIPRTKQHEVLLRVIIAISALHMSNAAQIPLISDKKISTAPVIPTVMQSTALSASTVPQSNSYRDALAARQRALFLLRSVLDNLWATDIDLVLAVVLFLTEFELIDSGKDHWRGHLNGARTIIDILGGVDELARSPMSPLRSCLISNCLVFDVLGSTLTHPTRSHADEFSSNGLSQLLQVAEANNCVSCPAFLLQLMRAGAHLTQSHQGPSNPSSSSGSEGERALLLLHAAKSFDPLAWATTLQENSPHVDHIYRVHIAAAHRAAAQIYLSRVLVSVSSTTEIVSDFESLVADVISHLSSIPVENALFKASTWPTFIAGAETKDPALQAWVVARLRALWAAEPWGLIRGALGILEGIWSRTNNEEIPGGTSTTDWLQNIRRIGMDWLIA